MCTEGHEQNMEGREVHMEGHEEGMEGRAVKWLNLYAYVHQLIPISASL